MRRATATALLCALLVALSTLQTSTADHSWDYLDVQSKDEAVARATGASSKLATLRGVVAARRSDSGNATGNATRGQGACTDAMFNDWAATFNLTFGSTTRQAAMQRFCANMERVKAINSDPTIPFWASGNAYTHLSFEEFSARFLTRLPVKSRPMPSRSRKLMQGNSAAPQQRYVNWVEAGKVTPIRNQGGCNSCWAFAAASVIESMYLIKFGGNASDPKMHLSEQQLVSCVSNANGYQSRGCNSGLTDEAIDYAAANNLTLNSLYPYTATTATCNAGVIAGATPGQAVRLAGYTVQVRRNDEAALMRAVQTAPTAFYFSVDSSFVLYAGGIYTPLASNTGAVNHGMVAVGFDATNANSRHWVIRNSWGTTWGERGYARVRMTGAANNGMGPCGMYQYAYLPPSEFVTTTPLQLTPPAAQSNTNTQYVNAQTITPQASPRYTAPQPSVVPTPQTTQTPTPRASPSNSQSTPQFKAPEYSSGSATSSTLVVRP